MRLLVPDVQAALHLLGAVPFPERPLRRQRRTVLGGLDDRPILGQGRKCGFVENQVLLPRLRRAAPAPRRAPRVVEPVEIQCEPMTCERLDRNVVSVTAPAQIFTPEVESRRVLRDSAGFEPPERRRCLLSART